MSKTIMYTGVLGLTGALVTAFLVPSCDTECPDDPRAVVSLKIVNPGGQDTLRPGRVENVTYTFLAGDDITDLTNRPKPRPASCVDEDCTEWILDAGEPGIFDITATVCGEQYTQRVEVYPQGEECFMVAKEVVMEVSPKACPDAPPEDPPEKCDSFNRPSVWATVLKNDGSSLTPVVPRDGVWFETRGERFPAVCVPKNENECWGWVAGMETLGRFTVGTEFCDNEVTETVTVTKTHDGCHADTQWVSLIVDTLGCLRAAPEPGPDFDPPLSDRPTPPDSPAGPEDVSDRMPGGDPPPPPQAPR